MTEKTEESTEKTYTQAELDSAIYQEKRSLFHLFKGVYENVKEAGDRLMQLEKALTDENEKAIRPYMNLIRSSFWEIEAALKTEDQKKLIEVASALGRKLSGY